MEEPCRHRDKGGKFHVPTNGRIQPAPLLPEPIPGQLLAHWVGQHAPVPSPQVLRLDRGGVFKVVNQLLQPGWVVNLGQSRRQILFVGRVAGLPVGRQQRLE